MVKYSKEIAEAICERIATSLDSLKTICAADGMPSHINANVWLRKHPEFCDMYHKARKDQQDLVAEECQEIADSCDASDWQVAKLRIEQRRWLASKLAPKRYGDKIVHSGDAEAPLTFNPAADVIINFLLAKGATEAEINQMLSAPRTIEHEK